MGAWDNGLLDNDCSQDFIESFACEVEQDIVAIHENDSRKLAGNLSAAVGILLRLSHRFAPFPGLADPPHFYPRLVCALSANMKHFVNFPGNSPQLLAAVLAGRGEELSSRPSVLSKRIDTCLFGGNPGVLQRGISKLEQDLFLHPSSQTYMSGKTKKLVRDIELTLKDRGSVIDMSYSSLGGMLGILLVLPFRGLKKSKIERWANQCQKIWNSQGAADQANDLVFELGFRKNVRVAFDCAAKFYARG